MNSSETPNNTSDGYLREAYNRFWVGEQHHTQGEFARRFKVSQKHLARYIRGKEYSQWIKAALIRWIHEDAPGEPPKLEPVCDGLYLRPIASAQMQMRLKAIEDLKWVLFCDDERVGCIVRDLRAWTLPAGVAVCIFTRPHHDGSGKLLRFWNKNVFVVKTHSAAPRAADHLLTLNFALAHASLPETIAFAIIAYSLVVSPELICEARSAGRLCERVKEGKPFQEFFDSIGSKKVTHLPPESPVYTIAELRELKGHLLLGAKLRLLGSYEPTNKVVEFLRFSDVQGVVWADDGEIMYIPPDLPVRIQW